MTSKVKTWAIRGLIIGIVFGLMFLVGQVSTISTFAQLPGFGVGGRLLLTLDSWLMVQDTGTGYNYFGPVRKLTPPAAAGSWTQQNFGSSTAATAYGGLFVAPQAASPTQFRGLTQAQPSTPYTITARFRWFSHTTGGCGIGWRESATSKITVFFVDGGNATLPTYLWQGYNGLVSPGATKTYLQQNSWQGADKYQELRIKNDGANLSVYHTPDGSNWLPFGAAITLNDYFTTAPDQVLFFAYAPTTTSGYDYGCTLLSWEVQ